MPELDVPPPRTLVEGLVREDGTVVLADAYAVANLLGIEDQPLRLATRRLIAEGEFVQEGRGRAGILRRTAAADQRERHDAEFVQLAYAQDCGQIVWPGVWHLLAVSVPESQRAQRDRLRRTLSRLGAGVLNPGLYVSPHPWGDHLRAEFPHLAGLDRVVTAEAHALTVGGHSDPAQIARLLWPLADLADGHAALLAATAEPAPDDRTARLAHMLRLAHLFSVAHLPDPLLPPELLPPDWIGTRARAAFAAVWRELTAGSPDVGLFTRFRFAGLTSG